MTKPMRKQNGTGEKRSRAFRDGTIDIKRWKARRRTERFVALVGRRTLGLVGTLVLALPAVAALVWINWPSVSQYTLVVDVLRCVGVMAVCLAPCVALLIPIRILTRVPSFVFRKLMHTVAFATVAIAILTSGSWQAASLTFALAAVAAFSLLPLLEGERWYGQLLVQKAKGEVRRSLTMYFGMAAVLVALCWGVFSRPEIAATAIVMWGAGDAAAALVGIPFGRHKVRRVEGKKSWEGSLAILAFSFVGGLCMLLLVQRSLLTMALLSSGIGALLGTVAELFSPGEYDTVTVPIAITAALLLI